LMAWASSLGGARRIALVALLGVGAAGACRRPPPPAPPVCPPAPVAAVDKEPAEPPPRALRRCFTEQPAWVDAPVADLLDRAAELFDKGDYAGTLACAEEAA